jgi:hypothetical protein
MSFLTSLRRFVIADKYELDIFTCCYDRFCSRNGWPLHTIEKIELSHVLQYLLFPFSNCSGHKRTFEVEAESTEGNVRAEEYQGVLRFSSYKEIERRSVVSTLVRTALPNVRPRQVFSAFLSQ